MLPNSRSPGLGLLARAVDVVEDPADLRAREVGRQRQAGLLPEAVLAAVARRARRRACRCGCPARRSRCGPARRSFLSHTTAVSRWLVMPRPAMSSALAPAASSASSMTSCDARPDLLRVVLDPARLGEDLLVLLLGDARRPRRRGRRSCTACSWCPGRGLLRTSATVRSLRLVALSRAKASAAAPHHQERMRRRPRVLVARAALAEVARAALAGDQRDRRLMPSSAASAARSSAPATSVSSPAPRSASAAGPSASSIVLSPGSALPRALDALDARVAARRRSRPVSSSDLPAADWPICRNNVP